MPVEGAEGAASYAATLRRRDARLPVALAATLAPVALPGPRSATGRAQDGMPYFCEAGQCGFCLPGLHCFEPGPGGPPNADPTAESANALASTIAVSFRFMGRNLLSRN